MSFVGVETGVTSVTVGVEISIVKGETSKIGLGLPRESVTLTVQFECVPAASALNVIVLLPTVAFKVALEQSPP